MIEAFACPLCGGTSFNAEITLKDRIMRTSDALFLLARCLDCGLLRLHPQPDGVALAGAYPDEYAPHVRKGISGWAKSALERRSARLLAEHLAEPRRVLDVGCATGDLLLAIRSRGNPDVTGVETSAAAVAVARERGLNIVEGEIFDAGFPAGAFDTVLISHTLEHVPDPLVFMREVQRVLSPDGAVILWLPNAGSVERRVFGRFWIGYDAPRHLTTFTVGTLGSLLRSAGFQIEEVRHEVIGLEWAWGLRLLLREWLPTLEGIMRRLHPVLILLFTPAAMLSARLRRSGRIRVVAARRESTLV
ncbi:class I SAM-dependent methyltransferase [soil metagenome]